MGFGLGLSDAAGELFGEGVADFLRGESVLSAKSGQLLISAVRSGVLADDNLLSGETAQSVLDTVSSLFNSAAGSTNSAEIEQKLSEALSQLSESERKRLDDIVEELIQRSISRATNRLAGV